MRSPHNSRADNLPSSPTTIQVKNHACPQKEDMSSSHMCRYDIILSGVLKFLSFSKRASGSIVRAHGHTKLGLVACPAAWLPPRAGQEYNEY